jgi:hypothetical protein
MGDMKNEYNIFVGKPKLMSPFRRPRGRLEDNIKMNLGEIEWEDVDWIHLAQNRDR